MELSSAISAEMAQRIELWPIERLVPYEHNARTHSDPQIRQIANSMTEFGFTNPILVDTQAGIIAGHARLLAARQLKLQRVPVIVLSHLSEAQKRAYILADNRLALDAGWDDVDVSVRRGQLYTAACARRSADGRTFDAVSAEVHASQETRP